MKRLNTNNSNAYKQEVDLPKGHPIPTNMQETGLIHQLICELNQSDIENKYQLFYYLFKKQPSVEHPFERMENHLFPLLAKSG